MERCNAQDAPRASAFCGLPLSFSLRWNAELRFGAFVALLRADLEIGAPFCSRGSIIRAPRFERGGCRWESCRERHLETRSGEFGTRSSQARTRLASNSALRVPYSAFSCRVGPIGRGVPLRTGRLKVRLLHAARAFTLRASARRVSFRSVNRTSGPGLGANECAPSGVWCESTALRHFQVERGLS